MRRALQSRAVRVPVKPDTSVGCKRASADAPSREPTAMGDAVGEALADAEAAVANNANDGFGHPIAAQQAAAAA
jgi:hypothetical protein